jgi:hypothetical protein
MPINNAMDNKIERPIASAAAKTGKYFIGFTSFVKSSRSNSHTFTTFKQCPLGSP